MKRERAIFRFDDIQKAVDKKMRAPSIATAGDIFRLNEWTNFDPVSWGMSLNSPEFCTELVVDITLEGFATIASPNSKQGVQYLSFFP